MGKLGDEIRKKRRQAGLTLAQLARRADTSVAALSRYEKGWNRFEIPTLEKLAQALGCRLVIRFVRLKKSPGNVDAKALVKALARLHWDHPLGLKELRRYPQWVLERVLELGDLEDLRLLMAFWGKEAFLDHAARVHFSNPKTRVFWEKMLEKEGRRCTRKFSRKEAGAFWKP
jgi:transcriptional regulator with XRE-family HTH domain